MSGDDNKKKQITKTHVKPHKRSNPKSPGTHKVSGHEREIGRKTKVKEHWREIGGARKEIPDITPQEDPNVEEIKEDVKRYADKNDITVEEAVEHLRKSPELRRFMYGTTDVSQALDELEQEHTSKSGGSRDKRMTVERRNAPPRDVKLKSVFDGYEVIADDDIEGEEFGKVKTVKEEVESLGKPKTVTRYVPIYPDGKNGDTKLSKNEAIKDLVEKKELEHLGDV